MAWLSAPSAPAASAAPAGMRITVCTVSHSESTQRDLVGEELDEQHEAAGRQHDRVLQHLQARAAGRSSPGSRPAPVRNTAAYRRRPLAQPSAAASASSCGVSTRLRERVHGQLSSAARRLALLQEGLHAFAAFVAGADVGDALARSRRISAVVISLAAPRPAPAACRPSPPPGRLAPAPARCSATLRVERVGRHHLVHEADAQRLGRARSARR